MTDALTHLRAAQQAIRAGDRRAARQALELAVRQDPENYRAWLWLAGVASSPTASLAYLERAEALRPGDPQIAQARSWAMAKAGISTPPAEPRSTRRRWPWYALATVVVLAAVAYGALMLAPDAVESLMGRALAPGVPAVAQSEPVGEEEAVPAATETGAATPAAKPSSESDLNTGPELEVGLTVAATATERPQPTETPEPGLPAKEVRASSASRPTWTPTPLPTPTPSPTPPPTETPVPTEAPPVIDLGTIPIAAGEHWIDVNLTTQSLVAYSGAEPVYSTLVSSGIWQFPTVTGQFRIYLRFESQDMSGFHLGFNYYLPSVPHVMYFYEDYALHGAYWHNNFGTPMSHGCVNLALDDAAWLYDFASEGTLVNVHY